MSDSPKLTERQIEALLALRVYGHSGSFQKRLNLVGHSSNVLRALAKKGLAERIDTMSGRTAWFITDAGRAAAAEAKTP